MCPHLFGGLYLGLDPLEEAVHDHCSRSAALSVDARPFQANEEVCILVEPCPVHHIGNMA